MPTRDDSLAVFRRGLGSPTLFAVIYIAVASAIYFSLGVVIERALGLTPFVYLVAGVFFALAAMTYVEGASLHQDRAGASVFARYAFNELVSFVAGWAILLDFVILIAVTAFSATNYLAAFYAPLGSGTPELLLSFGIVGYVAIRNVRGLSRRRVARVATLVVADIALQVALIVLGVIAFFDIDLLLDPIQLGVQPTWSDAVFALGVATVVFTGLESASGLSGEVRIGRRGLRRMVSAATLTVIVVYTGIAVVAVTALPVGTPDALPAELQEAPLLAVAGSFETEWLADALRYTLAAAATLTLVGAANSAMLGLSRLAYSLSTNRQIPTALGRLHPTRSTPYIVIGLAAIAAAALTIPQDLELLVGIYAFGALVGLTIAHVSIIALRFREPGRDRAYRVPFNVGVRGTQVPLPAMIGAVASVLAFVAVVVTHDTARWVGLAWMCAGIVLYVVYRSIQGQPLFKRVLVPEEALRRGERAEAAYGSILVPLFGTPLDDDIVQTAGRLAAEEDADAFDEGHSATIEALWIFEVPMSLPLDAALPEAQLQRARTALARAKAVGEEYEGVEVATATVRARRAGHAIVEQAKRLGVHAVVLAAEEPTKIRGGALLGGRGGPRDNFVGELTKYVVSRAPCQVILTAPPATERLAEGGAGPDGAGPPDAPPGDPVSSTDD